MCDTHIFDRIVADKDVMTGLADPACGVGVVTTHVQEDEIAALADKDPKKAAALLAVPRRKIPTVGVVLGLSRLDQAKLSNGETFHAMRGESKTHIRDSLIASSAAEDADLLVTSDKRMTTRATALGITVWSWEDFRAAVLSTG
jgi:hypothetical protein